MKYSRSGRASQPIHVSVGSIMLKKSLMRSVEPSDQLLRAFFRPALRPPSGRTGEFSAGVQRSMPLDATGAQAMHAVGVFSNGRQIWLARA